MTLLSFFLTSQLKISFNESSLQSTFEYPSESSVWDSGEEEEERRGGGGGEEEGGVSVERIHIPRSSYTSSPTAHSPNSTGERKWTELEEERARVRDEQARKCIQPGLMIRFYSCGLEEVPVWGNARRFRVSLVAVFVSAKIRCSILSVMKYSSCSVLTPAGEKGWEIKNSIITCIHFTAIKDSKMKEPGVENVLKYSLV